MADEIFQNGENFRGYVIEKLLGRGGLGAVYLARHELMDQLFAIKILYPNVAREKPEYVRRFVREARIAAKISHPNLVSVHNVGYDNVKDVYFLVMDYVDGSDLRTAIAMGGAMDPREALRIVSAVAKALAAGEPYGIVHRDIKPENIMLTHEGHVKLVDLGVAKASGTDSLRTMAKTVFGTPNYISPEQAQDSSQVDSRADVYSLGIVLFEMLAGRRPYECKKASDVLQLLLSDEPLPDVRTFAPNVSPELAALVARMCEKDVEKRLASASKVLEEISLLDIAIEDEDTEDEGLRDADTGKTFSYSYYLSGEAKASDEPFVTKDEEIMSFLAERDSKRRLKRVLKTVLVVAVASLVLLGLALLIF